VIQTLPPILWVLLAAVIWWRIEPGVLGVLSALATHRVAPQPPAPQGPKADPMPVALMLMLTDESEPWAKEQQMQQANELYAKYGDWDKVMEALSR
jgi:hypothetical protein